MVTITFVFQGKGGECTRGQRRGGSACCARHLVLLNLDHIPSKSLYKPCRLLEVAS